jgi:hypothetical protein
VGAFHALLFGICLLLYVDHVRSALVAMRSTLAMDGRRASFARLLPVRWRVASVLEAMQSAPLICGCLILRDTRFIRKLCSAAFPGAWAMVVV